MGIGILHLLRSVLILSVVMTIASTALRIISSGGSAMLQASSYAWMISGIIFAATIYVFSLLVVRKHNRMLQKQ